MTLAATNLTHTAIEPFGVVVQPADGTADLTALAPAELAHWAEEARVLVLRGFEPLGQEEFVALCRSWGELLRWDFGEVLELVLHDDPKNYLFTPGLVPYHWDGAFAAAEPHFMVFQCVQAPAPDSGGETVFCDTARVCEAAGAERVERWRHQQVRYRTDKVEHYGGDITVPLASTHPTTGAPRLRYAEPLAPEEFLNPLFVDVLGAEDAEQQRLVDELAERLYAPDVCYAHPWQDGDVVVADNFAVLHGRRPIGYASPRHLRRIHVL
jgi:alpha-ketoglutarate-dependent taurine dioxygenase